MTRLRLLALGLWATAILGPTQVTQADFPLLSGAVFHDKDSSGSKTPGDESLQGIAVKLFADNGDGFFDPNVDEMVNTEITDLEGAYGFSGLGMGMGYFLQRDEQVVDGITIPGGVSGLLTPVKFNSMIDDFSDQQVTNANPIQTFDSSNMTSSSVLGGQRDLHVKYMSGAAESTLRANPYGLNKVLEFAQSAGVISIATVTWDGIDGDMSITPAVGGLGGIDIIADGSQAFAFDLGIDAAGEGEMLVVRVYSGSEMSAATLNIPVTDGTASEFQVIPFDSFVGGASFDSIDAIQIELGGNQPSIDAQLGPIGSIAPAIHDIAVMIPEPSAILLVLFGAVWFVGLRRRRVRGG